MKVTPVNCEFGKKKSGFHNGHHELIKNNKEKDDCDIEVGSKVLHLGFDMRVLQINLQQNLIHT